jgi:hypothetical protein
MSFARESRESLEEIQARHLPGSQQDVKVMGLMRAFHAVMLVVLVALPAAAAEGPASLEHGYRLMYGLNFASAEHEFIEWQREHPDDPLGPMSKAANLLFRELNRSGILQAQFFVDDGSFTSRKPIAPDPGLRARFEAIAADAEAVARTRLASDPYDRDALFALAMVFGLRADYAALIDGRNVASLSYTRQAARLARTLLDVAPDYADAYLATGIAEYIVGSLIAPVRWILRIAGYAGDKARGMQQLRLTAERGRFLGPFARILLAIAYLRERRADQARELLIGLDRDFPSNPLFAREIRRLDGKGD